MRATSAVAAATSSSPTTPGANPITMGATKAVKVSPVGTKGPCTPVMDRRSILDEGKEGGVDGGMKGQLTLLPFREVASTGTWPCHLQASKPFAPHAPSPTPDTLTVIGRGDDTVPPEL